MVQLKVTVGLAEVLEVMVTMTKQADLRLKLAAQVAKIHAIGLQLVQAADLKVHLFQYFRISHGLWKCVDWLQQ